MDQVHGEARDVIHQQDLPVELTGPHERRNRVHDAAVDEDGGQSAEDTQRHPRPAQQPLAEQDAGQEPDDAHGEHLPGRPRPLREHDVGRQHGHRAHQEPGLPPEGHARNDGQRHDGLELGQHEECRPPRHSDGAEHGDDHKLPGLGLVPLEDEEKGRHAFQQDQQGDEVILFVAQIVDAHKQGHGDKQQNHHRRRHGALGEPAFPSRHLHRHRRRPGAAADGQSEDEQGDDQRPVDTGIAGAQGGGAVRAHQGREVGDPQRLQEGGRRHQGRDRRDSLAPPGERSGLFVRAPLRRRGQRPVVLRQLGDRGQLTAAGGDDVLRRYRLRQQAPRHAVCGGGVKAVAGEKCPGRGLRNDAAVKEQGAAVGVPGTELNVVAHHEDGHAPAEQRLEDLGEHLLELRVQALGGLVINRISGSSSSTFASAARCCSPPDRS